MIVGLDLSLTGTGVCVDGVCDTIRVKNQTGMDRLHSIRQEVLEACDGAALVLLEGYSYASAHAAHQLGELGGIVRYSLWDCSIPYVDVQPSTLKQFATGKGNANKDTMIATAARAGCPVDDNNAVDAWWLWQLGIYSLCPARLNQPGDSVYKCDGSRHVPQTTYRDKAVAAVTWPADRTAA